MKAVMSRFLALAAFGAMFLPQARLHAQITATAPQAESSQSQRWDVFGGAQYAHFNPSPGAEVRAVNLLGWQGSATAWFRPLWGIEANARGEYGSLAVPPNIYGVPAHPPMSEHLFLFGPSFRFYHSPKVTLGMHFLIGAAYGSFDSGFPHNVQPQMLSIYNNKLAFGMADGGFADYNVRPHWAVRFVADYQPTHYGYAQQSEFAGAVGLVYKIGKLNR